MIANPPRFLVSIDPGNRSGVAVFHAGSLVRNFHSSCPHAVPLPLFPLGSGVRLDSLVIELPQHYPYGGGLKHKQIDPNDLIKVAVNVGEWKALNPAASCALVHPRQWKGQVPKEITQMRVRAALVPAELAVLCDDHNAIDAAGIGLWFLGRYR